MFARSVPERLGVADEEDGDIKNIRTKFSSLVRIR